MGLDLAVYPLGQFPPFIESHVWLAHTRIGFHRESALFKIIMRQLPQIPVPDQVEISGYFSTYEKRRHDPYGNLLTYVLPKQFEGLTTDDWWNKAILEFLVSLKPDTKVVLYWH